LIFIWVSLAVGVILGNTFLHLIPESFEFFSHNHLPSLLICGGIVLFFIAEKALHWHHHHVGGSKIKPLGKIINENSIIHQKLYRWGTYCRCMDDR
ncbi:MAG TPA: ZIP family metal transporter, partial [Bacteroidales bacterium]|nr:ZIP family metal transporter [Bacteroidales bacterium]